MLEQSGAKALRRGDPEGGPRSTHRNIGVGRGDLREGERGVERQHAERQHVERPHRARTHRKSDFGSAEPSTAREKVRQFALDQIRLRELEGHQQAPIAYEWAARELGLGKTTVIKALTALHRRGEVVATGGFSSRKHIRYWARGDGNPHTWPPPKPGPIKLPGSREAYGGELLTMALDRVRPGTRNETGLWLACQLRDKGWTIEMAWCLMEVYAASVPQPDQRRAYTFREAAAAMEQAYRREAREPFRVTTPDPAPAWSRELAP